MEETDRQLLEECAKSAREVSQLMKGYNGQDGLIKQVQNNSKAIIKIWITLAVLIASTGGGAFAILQALIG